MQDEFERPDQLSGDDAEAVRPETTPADDAPADSAAPESVEEIEAEVAAEEPSEPAEETPAAPEEQPDTPEERSDTPEEPEAPQEPSEARSGDAKLPPALDKLGAAVKMPLDRLDQILYDPEKHEQAMHEQQGIEERDFKPIRRRRDSRIGCMGGLMYFVFVVSISIILACFGWMAASDVLALNKTVVTGTVTLPAEIFTEEQVQTEDSDGNPVTKTVSVADIDYVASVLKSSGIIEYPFLFKFYCKLSHADQKLDPGTYDLTTELDYRALVKNMQVGSSSMQETTLTFYEGMTMKQIFELLEENGICKVDDLMDAAANSVYNYSFLDWCETGDASRLEGYLFPDTYNFYPGMQASTAINKFLSNFNGKLTADMYTQADNQGITFHQAIIIASIIESEAANDAERSTIASVIYNRLADGMLLQFDSTVIYAIGEHRELTAADLLIDSPYNTYMYSGLPAGPISNPGLPSINAALNPASTNYYYYALNAETGVHEFFHSFEEQQAFVATQDYSAEG